MQNSTPTTTPKSSTVKVSYSFDPRAERTRDTLLDYIEAASNGQYYDTPVNLRDLARTRRYSPHHDSALGLKVNMLTMSHLPNKYISNATFKSWAQDFLTFGNAYLERVRSKLGGTHSLRHAPALHLRKCDEQLYGADRYLMITTDAYTGHQYHVFAPGAVHHLLEPDVVQEVYGLPQYLAAISSAALNDSATVFRRRYYENGSHAGYILYLTDPNVDQASLDAMTEVIRNTRGEGNFKNVLLHSPGSQPGDIKLIPISEVAAKDDFTSIKTASRDDVLAAHRVPPQLLGMVPANAGGFGNILDQAAIFHAHEIAPLQQQMSASLNAWFGDDVLLFRPYTPPITKSN